MLHNMTEQILDLAFSGLQIGVGIYDKDGQMVSCNEEFRKLQRNNFYLNYANFFAHFLPF